MAWLFIPLEAEGTLDSKKKKKSSFLNTNTEFNSVLGILQMYPVNRFLQLSDEWVLLLLLTDRKLKFCEYKRLI